MKTRLPSNPELQVRYPETLARAGQIIWVEANGWEELTGTMTLLDRKSDAWRVQKQIPVTLGRTGMIPGNGILTYPGKYPHKAEGDGKTPVGVYPVLFAYGYAPKKEAPEMGIPYLPVTKRMRCVDDPKSRYYNKLVDLNLIEKRDWNSAEEMYRNDDLYKWGIVIDYNFTQVVQGAGSCVFFHLWRSPESPTAGCTAMTEANMLELLEWLDDQKHPLVVATPRVWRDAFRQLLKLPDII